MDRQRLLRISVVDEAAQSPRIVDEETVGDWAWRPSAGGSRSPTPLHLLQSPSVLASNNSGAARNGSSAAAANGTGASTGHAPLGLRHRRSSSPVSRGAAVMEKIMNPVLDREPSAEHPYGQNQHDQRDRHHQHQHQHQYDSYSKASAFDDDYHSLYVAKYPRGVRGLFVLFQSPTLLLAIGLFSAFVGLFIDFWLVKIAEYHNQLSDWGFKYFVASALLAATFAATLVHLICPQAAGSGLPYMKVAISGVDMAEYLSLRCIVTKIAGLVAAYLAGLSIGKEGPFIMISCGFASVLMNLPVFQRINNDETKRLEMLACACSAGVAATFGSPFGGVLFGVEVTSHFYMVRTLPRSFFAAIVGALLVNFVTSNTRYGLFGNSSMGITDVSDWHRFSLTDLAVFIAMGAVCGVGGAFFNFCISILVRLRDQFLREDTPSTPTVSRRSTTTTTTAAGTPVVAPPGFRMRLWRRLSCGSSGGRVLSSALSKRLLLVVVVTLVSCVTEFYGDSAWFIRHGSPHRILEALFSKTKTPFNVNGTGAATGQDLDDEDSRLLSRSLITFLPLKFVLTLVSVVLPIPAGLFTPTFVIGGIFGRLVGEAINAFDLLSTQYEPFEFAIIGAGAFSSGVTHAISTAVIIMEISHSDGLNLPVSIAILASYFTAKRFSENVYDVLISTSKLPRLKKLPKAAYDIPSWEVMRDVKDMNYLTADSTYADALRVLRGSREPIFPIVDDSDNLFLLATVTRRRLEGAVIYCQQKMLDNAALLARATNRGGNLSSTPASVRTPLRSSHSLPVNGASYGAVATPSPAIPATIAEHDVGSFASTAALQFNANLLEWPVHFAFRRGGNVMEWGTNEPCTRTKLTVLINPSPFQLMEMTPMKRVDLLFRMLKLNNAYITRSGRLVGLITRDRLMTFLGKTKKYKVPGLCSTLSSCCWESVRSDGRRRRQRERSSSNTSSSHADREVVV